MTRTWLPIYAFFLFLLKNNRVSSFVRIPLGKRKAKDKDNVIVIDERVTKIAGGRSVS